MVLLLCQVCGATRTVPILRIDDKGIRRTAGRTAPRSVTVRGGQRYGRSQAHRQGPPGRGQKPRRAGPGRVRTERPHLPQRRVPAVADRCRGESVVLHGHVSQQPGHQSAHGVGRSRSSAPTCVTTMTLARIARARVQVPEISRSHGSQSVVLNNRPTALSSLHGDVRGTPTYLR